MQGASRAPLSSATLPFFSQEALHEVETRDHGRIPVFVRHAGEGPRMLLLHGWMHSGERWRNILPLLAGHYALVAVDLPGFGNSPALKKRSYSLREYSEVVREVVDQEAPQGYDAIVADSLGAVLVLDWLSSGVLPTKRVLVSGCPADGVSIVPRAVRSQGLVSAALALSRAMPSRLAAVPVRLSARNTFHQRALVDDILQRDARRASPHAAGLLLHALGAYRYEPVPTPGDIRFVVVRGQHDRVVSKACAERLAASLQATLLEIPDVGHTPMVEDPEMYVEAISRLFGSA